MELQKAIDLFLSEYIESTRRSYYYVLRDMRDWVGPARPIKDIRTDQILEFMSHRREAHPDQSPATYNKYVKTLRTFFNWCVRLGFIEKSPAAGVKLKRQKKAKGKDKAMPETLYERLLDYAQWDARYHALVLFLGDTGCRIGGAAGLTWDDIDFEIRRAIVTEKGKPPRPVFFGVECARALSRWRGQHTMSQPEKNYVFQRHGRRMKNDSLGLLFERICQRAGIGQWGPHSLRHRKGHQFADQKIAPSIASKALGHESVMTTLEYYYPDDWDRVAEEINKLATREKEGKITYFPGKTGDM